MRIGLLQNIPKCDVLLFKQYSVGDQDGYLYLSPEALGSLTAIGKYPCYKSHS
jgi:hypothetical protein